MITEMAQGAAIPPQATEPAAERYARTSADKAAESFQLVARIQAGDRAAFGEVYERYRDMVFRFVFFRVGNRHHAEDVTQEVFLRALRRIDSVRWQGSDLGAWLVTIARNLVVDQFKSGRYRLERLTGDVYGLDVPDCSAEGMPEQAVVEHDRNVALLSALYDLKADQRECLVARFVKGLSVAETAVHMGKNEGAIKALQYRAVRSMLRVLPAGLADAC